MSNKRKGNTGKKNAVKSEEIKESVTPETAYNRPVPVEEPRTIERVRAIPVEKKVCIVGCSSSKSLAPFDNPEYEIWGVNNLYHHVPRATRWFEIHHITEKDGVYYRRDQKEFRGQTVNDYLKGLGEWGVKNNCPVYMQKKWDIVPTSVEYPIDDMTKAFGGYFTNTISYELALAIVERFTEIAVYGVDMAVDTEYHHQRPSCEFFLGIAFGQGIKINIPDEADLLKTRFLYGFQEPLATAWNNKMKMMNQAINEKQGKCQGEINQLKHQTGLKEQQLQQYIGARVAAKEVIKIWG